MTTNEGFKIIDFRNRPPLMQYKGIFERKHSYFQAERSNVLNSGANTVTPAMNVDLVGTEEGMQTWWNEIDEAGIDAVVVNGRYTEWGCPTWSITNEAIADLEKRYSGRLHGLASINLDQSPKKTAEELEIAFKEYGLRGANIEPGYKESDRGISIDDPYLGPIFEVIKSCGAFLQIQTGMLGGADIGNNNPPALDRFLLANRSMQVVIAHGGYPYVSEMLGLATKHAHLTIMPDVYMFYPGGQLYAANVNKLPDQFIYGSCFPFASMKEPIRDTLALRTDPWARISDSVMERYLYGNAARLLKLTS